MFSVDGTFPELDALYVPQVEVPCPSELPVNVSAPVSLRRSGWIDGKFLRGPIPCLGWVGHVNSQVRPSRLPWPFGTFLG